MWIGKSDKVCETSWAFLWKRQKMCCRIGRHHGTRKGWRKGWNQRKTSRLLLSKRNAVRWMRHRKRCIQGVWVLFRNSVCWWLHKCRRIRYTGPLCRCCTSRPKQRLTSCRRRKTTGSRRMRCRLRYTSTFRKCVARVWLSLRKFQC